MGQSFGKAADQLGFKRGLFKQGEVMSSFNGGCLAVLSIALTGCAMAWPANKPTPLWEGQIGAAGCAEPKLLRQGETPPASYMLANLGAHGNGYATMPTLEGTLLKEGQKFCADYVLVVNDEVTKDETIGSYSGGLMMASQIQRPHLYGVALRKVKGTLGLHMENDYTTVKYVTKGGPADQAGIREGMKIVAVNGQFNANPFVISREANMREPGSVVDIEVMDGGEKRSIPVTLGQPQP